MKKKSDRQGMTLIELMISVSLTLILWSGFAYLIRDGIHIKKEALGFQKELALSQIIHQMDPHLSSLGFPILGSRDDVIFMEKGKKKSSLKGMIFHMIKGRGIDSLQAVLDTLRIRYWGQDEWLDAWNEVKFPSAIELIWTWNDEERGYRYVGRIDEK